ncbi:hypothetical protein [Treponema denticola]|uniref:Polymorphic outer membrane protein n=1 Tax=Treponema denticola SP33 TaxID=999437 RepID=M2BQY8_TREDN|nr:hypothetical protein [Treponema denticola]EMB24439.1 hypothetical protein HMPREF9733_01391 [Treponema denticola SP33]EPF37911.1 hypothetical protein HMPREF9732_00505 [Treponema denticola SP32]
MKKILTKFLPLLLLISLISCNQLVVGIEKTFSYWANGATIIGIELPPNIPVDGDGFSSLPSSHDARICFKLNNPQKFEFLMPNDSNVPADIIVFDGNVKGNNGGRPKFGEDYSLIQKDSDTLELTYKKEFLLKNEQGKANLNPKIKLYNKKDNRRFVQNYNYKLRANTVPPKPEWFTTGKIQQGTDWYYVLIFKFEGLTNSTDIENFLHKDISEVYLTEGESQKPPIQVKLKNNGFDVSDSQGNLIPADKEIKPLAPTDLTGGGPTSFEPIPAANSDDRKWMLCIKTGVKIGQSLSYEVKVKDWKGLVSEETPGVINAAKLPVPQISYNSGMAALTSSGVYTDDETALNNHSSSSTNPILISSCFGNPVVLKAHNTAYLSDVTIVAEVKLSASTQPSSSFTGPTGSSQQDGNITKILLDPIPGVDEIYEVKVKAIASGSNYTDSDEKTYYYQIKKEVRAGTSSWQILKKAVNLASDRDTIYIKGHIISTDAANNSGEIEVKEDINIQGLNGKAGDIIDADSKHRIFEVKENKSLTLKNITLKKGKVEGSTYEATGGAIKAGNGSVLTLDNTDIADSEAGMAGGAISSTGNIDIKGNSVIRNNRTISSNGLGGAIYSGGTFKISGPAKITVDSGKNDVYLPIGKVITVTGALSEDSVARISPITPYTPDRQVVKGDGFTLPDTYVSKFNLTPKAGENWIIQKHDSQNALVLKKEATEITSWQGLQAAVDAARPGDTITVKNTLTADDTTLEISITKNLTIKGRDTSVVLNADEKHRIFKVYNGASLKLKDITLKKGKKDSGAGVHVTGGSLELENVTITECKNNANSGEGGAIYISSSSNGRLWIKGSSKILSNTAEKGAGIYIHTNSDANIIEGSTKISGNTCQSSGQGGGIYLYKGKLVLKDNAKILNNESMVGAAGGGGVYISEHGTLTIKDSCIIQGNKAKNSGGSVITGNGGGIYNSGNLIMEGGEIKDNEAKLGGAVYNNGTFKISGSAKIELSEGSDENTPGKNDVYLPAEKVITVTGVLTQTSVARISPANYPSLLTPTITVLAADSSVTLAYQVSKFKVTDGTDDKKWKINAAGELELANKTITVKTWADLKTEVEKTSEGADVIIVDGTLTADTSNDEIKVKRNVTIKGKDSSATLNANEKCRIFKVSNEVTLKLKDITLKKGKEALGVGVYVTEASLELENVTITECKSKTGTGMGGAIYINNLSHNGRLWIKGTSKIEVNGAYNGAGIYINTVSGENIIEGNTEIKGNKCFVSGNGGGIYIEKGNLVLKGNTKIFGNESKNSHTDGGGGGIYIKSGSTLTIKDLCEINNNKAMDKTNDTFTGYGGGICNLGTIIMEGGTMTGNEAKEGGAVYNNGTFTMSGSAKITPSTGEDKHKKGKNDVYLNNSTLINVSGTLTVGPNQAARITVPKYKYNQSTQVLDGSTTENANKFKVTKKGSEEWEVKSDGYLKKKN